MPRHHGSGLENPGIVGPETTVLEAADVMERLQDSKVLVERYGRTIGFLTERDIIERVLAHGDRPEEVTVWDVMTRTWREEDALDTVPARDDGGPEAPFLVSAQLYQGKCEECGDFSINIRERDGLLVCGDCAEAQAPFALT